MTRLMEWQCGAIGKARRSLEDARPSAAEAPRQARDLIRWADWLRERFPDAKLPDVGGVVKLADRAETEAHDWSLTPGRYVGVAPDKEDEGFDFEEEVRSIHISLEGLNEEAAVLAAPIARNFGELGA